MPLIVLHPQTFNFSHPHRRKELLLPSFSRRGARFREVLFITNYYVWTRHIIGAVLEVICPRAHQLLTRQVSLTPSPFSLQETADSNSRWPLTRMQKKSLQGDQARLGDCCDQRIKSCSQLIANCPRIDPKIPEQQGNLAMVFCQPPLHSGREAGSLPKGYSSLAELEQNPVASDSWPNNPFC